MDIKTIADLAKLADVCRKKGIEELSINAQGIAFRLGHKPQPKKRGRLNQATDDKIQIDKQYTQEDMLLWSAGGGIPDEVQG